MKGCHVAGYRPQYLNIGGFREIDNDQITTFLNILDPGRQISPPDQDAPLQRRLPVTPIQLRPGRARHPEQHRSSRSRSGPELSRRPTRRASCEEEATATPESADSLSEALEILAARWSKFAKKLLVVSAVVVVLTGALIAATTFGTETSGEPTPQRVPQLPVGYRHEGAKISRDEH